MQDETIQMIKKINQVVDKKNLATALRANLMKRKQQMRARQLDLTDDVHQHTDDMQTHKSETKNQIYCQKIITKKIDDV